MRLGMRAFVVLCFLYACAYGANGASLVIRFAYPTDQLEGADMYVRGESVFGLNWDEGVKMTNPSCDLYEYRCTIEAEDLRSNSHAGVKALVGDKDWQIGGNVEIDLNPLKENSTGSFSVTNQPFFYSSNGRYEYIRDVYSPQLDNYRDLVVYLPPSYDENPLKFHTNVIVAHDGQNLFNASTSFLGIAWCCDKTVDLLVNEGLMEEVVIIGVNNSPDRDNELTPDYDPSEKEGGKGDKYLDFLEETVLPLCHRNYRISTYQDSVAILGSSLGGLISCYAGWTRPTVYSKALCMSSSFWWNSQSFLNTFMPKKSPEPADDAVFYVDSGDAGPGEDDKEETIAVRDSMIKNHGFVLNENVFYYLDKGGEHNEKYWGDRFHIPMSELYPAQIVEPLHY